MNPLSGEIRVGGKRRDISVGSTDHNPDPGIRQRFYDSRIRSVQPHLLNARWLNKFHRLCRRREVVGNLAVVYTDKSLRIWITRRISIELKYIETCLIIRVIFR